MIGFGGEKYYEQKCVYMNKATEVIKCLISSLVFQYESRGDYRNQLMVIASLLFFKFYSHSSVISESKCYDYE